MIQGSLLLIQVRAFRRRNRRIAGAAVGPWLSGVSAWLSTPGEGEESEQRKAPADTRKIKYGK